MINISFKYVKILEFILFHEYFANGIPRPIKIAPSPATRTLMEKYNLVTKNIGNGVGVFTDKHNSIAFHEYFSVTDGLSFVFYIECQDKKFSQYTNIRQKAIDELLFFTNSKNLISKKEYVSNDDYVKLSSTELEFLNLETLQPRSSDIGVIRFQFEKAHQKQIDKILTSEKEEQPVSFTLKFPSPTSLWKYIFVPNNNDNQYNLEIKSLKSKLHFKPQKETASSNEFVFLSKEQIPISEKNGIKLELWNYKNKTDKTKGKILNPYLPVPRKTSFYSDALNSYVSEIYISI